MQSQAAVRQHVLVSKSNNLLMIHKNDSFFYKTEPLNIYNSDVYSHNTYYSDKMNKQRQGLVR